MLVYQMVNLKPLIPAAIFGLNRNQSTDNFGEPHCCYRQVVVLNIFYVHPENSLGKISTHFDEHLFQKGLVEQPPTSISKPYKWPKIHG